MRFVAGACSQYLLTRWVFLRSLGLIFFSAFYALLFQIDGLIGPRGLLPAGAYLDAVARAFPASRYWFAPSLLWIGSGTRALQALCWLGLAGSLLLILNLAPRVAAAICEVCYLSFIAAAQDFAGYQSDGMLLAAGFIAVFFAPPGIRPGLGPRHPPSRLSLFSLQWVWFQIYFESGVAKLASGDPQWRALTALDHYYENGPLPTWIGWYVQHLPHGFHAASTLATLLTELVVVWMVFLSARWRALCFCIVTPLQIGIILTANYTFLNYLVLALGFLLLKDGHFAGVLRWLRLPECAPAPPSVTLAGRARRWLARAALIWVLYAATALLLLDFSPRLPLPLWPIRALQPFRVANQYGLFGIMTSARFEIEFQGSADGNTWVAYPFRYKPQDVTERPRIYAPYQPRFDWNLWFASLGSWRGFPFVIHTAESLLDGDSSVLRLFRANPFAAHPPAQVRTVIWRYWFTDLATLRREHRWWDREFRGLYAPTLQRTPDGRYTVVEWPGGG